jgi:hypothetical protein
VFLETRFNGRLDFYDIADLLLDETSRLPVEQRDACAGAGSITRG